jgi:hypothetical protein
MENQYGKPLWETDMENHCKKLLRTTTTFFRPVVDNFRSSPASPFACLVSQLAHWHAAVEVAQMIHPH